MRYQAKTKDSSIKDNWQSWFAYYPVKLTDTDTWVWLETIERKYVWKTSPDFMGGSYKSWKYRLK